MDDRFSPSQKRDQEIAHLVEQALDHALGPGLSPHPPHGYTMQRSLTSGEAMLWYMSSVNLEGSERQREREKVSMCVYVWGCPLSNGIV